MASHEAYLRSALAKYNYAEQTKRELLTILSSFTDLRPTIQKYVFNDGIGKDLVCLDGTIPVPYKGKTYNIPICMWLMDTHPYNPPLVYVKPTSTMQIKPGRHVDHTGRIYLPYLHEWKHPKSDIIGSLEVLKIVFGEEPPVFAKPTSSPAQPVYQMAGAPNPALPYPAAPGGTSMPMPGYQPPSASPYVPPRGPSYPPAIASQGGYPGYSYPSQQTTQQASYPSYPPQQGYVGYPPYSGATRPGYPPPVVSQSASSSQQGASQAISEEHIRQSLITAVEDKMRRRMKDMKDQSQAEMQALKRTEEDLNKGRQKLDDMLLRLEREQNDVERNIRLIQEKEEEMKVVLAKMENREAVDIDDTVQPTAPLYKQLLNAFAEEQATEDAIYYMGEALRKGVIELDVFLKQIRELSRKQFTQRMIVQKCRQKAGLPDISG